MLVERASSFESEIFLERDGLKINAKSIMGVMMLAAEKGAELIIYAEGSDEEAAVKGIEDVIASGFDEEKA